MRVQYRELQYASTQFNLLSGTDGFGIRTYTHDLPMELIERFKARNLFYYESGSKMLCCVYDLINTPSIVLDYPKTVTFFREIVNGKTWVILTRTIFIGRDYGWYLDPIDQNARSGNTYTYALFLEENSQINDRTLFDYFSHNALPKDCINNPSNAELRRLLTNEQGKPDYLPLKTLELPEVNRFENIPNTLEFRLILRGVIQAISKNKKVVVVIDDTQTPALISAILACLPQFLCRSCSITTNYHGFNLETDYRMVFVNEFYQKNIDSATNQQGVLVFDYKNRVLPMAYPASDFCAYWLDLVEKQDFATLQNLLNGLDAIIENYTTDISLDQVFYVWLFLMTNKPTTHYPFEPLAVIKQINAYPLKNTFRDKIKDYIIYVFEQAVAERNHDKVAQSLILMESLDLETNTLAIIQAVFTRYFVAADNATKLLALNVSPNILQKNFLIKTQEEEHLTGFISNNKSMVLPSMISFVIQFCRVFPDKSEQFLFWFCLDFKPQSDFGRQLREQLGDTDFFDFLLNRQFFSGLEPQEVDILFKDALIVFFENVYQNKKEPFSYIQKAISVAPHTIKYLEYLTPIIKTKPYPDAVKLLLAFYTLTSEKPLQTEQIGAIGKLLNHLIKTVFNASRTDLDRLKEIVNAFKDRTAQQLSENLHLRLVLLRGLMSAYEDMSAFDESLKIINNKDLEPYLKFILRVTDIDIWETQKAQLFVRLLVKRFGMDADNSTYRYTFTEGSKNDLLNCIPYYMEEVIKNCMGKEVYEEALVAFYYNYTVTSWALSKQKSGKPEPYQSFFKQSSLYKTIESYLTALDKIEASICQQVVNKLRANPDMIDVNQHLEVNLKPTSTSGKLYDIFKKLPFSFKKNP